jgi:hypothetical protein
MLLVLRCGAMRCGGTLCGAAGRCGAVRCGVVMVQCGAVVFCARGAVRCSAVRCGAVRHGRGKLDKHVLETWKVNGIVFECCLFVCLFVCLVVKTYVFVVLIFEDLKAKWGRTQGAEVSPSHQPQT